MRTARSHGRVVMPILRAAEEHRLGMRRECHTSGHARLVPPRPDWSRIPEAGSDRAIPGYPLDASTIGSLLEKYGAAPATAAAAMHPLVRLGANNRRVCRYAWYMWV